MQIIILSNSISIVENGCCDYCTKSTCNLSTELPWYIAFWDKLGSKRAAVVKILLLILSEHV